MPAATCTDAGVYRCKFKFQTVISAMYVDMESEDEARLDMYPELKRCKIEDRKVNFAKLSEKPVSVRVECHAKTTVAQANWTWEMKIGNSWGPVSQELISRVIPAAIQRCTEPLVSIMVYPVRQVDMNRLFRVYIVHEKGQSQMVTFTVTDINGEGRDIDYEAGSLGTFKDALIATGWILLAMMIFVIIILLIAHVLYPAMTRVFRPWSSTATARAAGSRDARSADQQGTERHRRQRQEQQQQHQNGQQPPAAESPSRTPSAAQVSRLDTETVAASDVDRPPSSPVLSQVSHPSYQSGELSIDIVDSPGAEGNMSGSVSQSQRDSIFSLGRNLGMPSASTSQRK